MNQPTPAPHHPGPGSGAAPQFVPGPQRPGPTGPPGQQPPPGWRPGPPEQGPSRPWTAPRPAPSTRKWIIVGASIWLAATLVTVLILVATLRPLLHDPFATAAVGDCITLYTSEDAPGETIACDDTVNYSVLVTGIEAPQGCGYEEVYYEVRDWFGFGDNVERVTCLIPNFIEDHCYDVYDEDLFDFEIVDCTGADLRVTTAAAATWIDCAGDEELWAFARAERAYCLDWS